VKLGIAIAVVFWLLCGLAGAWRLGELDIDHWKTIASGPLTLPEAFNQNPVSYPVR